MAELDRLEPNLKTDSQSLLKLKRWIEMDFRMIRGHGMGLRKETIVKQFQISPRTFAADMKAFRDLGQDYVPRKFLKGLNKLTKSKKVPHVSKIVTYHYRPGVKPLFACNVGRRPEIREDHKQDAADWIGVEEF